MQRSQYVRNAPHKFKIGWRYVLLEPMDIVPITDAVCGLDAQAVRVLSVEEDEEGGLTIEAEEIATGASLPPPPPVVPIYSQTSAVLVNSFLPPRVMFRTPDRFWYILARRS